MIAVLAAAVLAAVSPSPSPLPSTAAYGEIGRVAAPNRATNLVGRATAASEGTIGAAQIEARPIARPGEILEAVPGLVISQHSGEGKANQYYLRGFQLDHGTDLSATIVGQPINLPTHAHGQGYSDINWLIPELVGFVQYKKGPYYADEGDFSTAGSYDLFYRNAVPEATSATLGTHGVARFLAMGAPQLGAGRLLYAAEYYHDDGSFEKPDNYRRYNGVLRWSRSDDRSDFNVTALAYGGRFGSSDQVPQRLIDTGTISRFGYVDPTDAGSTYRYALSTEFQKTHGSLTDRFSAYAIAYQLDLFSNFTYFLDDATDYYNVTANPLTCSTGYATCAPDPGAHVASYRSYCPSNHAPAGAGGAPAPFSFSCGDQREQFDRRFVSGFELSRTFTGDRAATTLGLSLRNDNISTVGLYLTHDRVRYPDGTLSDDHVVQRELAFWLRNERHLTDALRLAVGLRGESYGFNILANVPANSGYRTAGLLLPKATLAYRASPSSEFYLNAGQSYHTNDARGLTITTDPQTHTTVDPSGAPVQPVTPLVRAEGEEVGYRFGSRRLTSTLALWRLAIASELVFDGDHGTTSAGRPTVRRGIELTNFWSPLAGLTFDVDVAASGARFTTDPDHVGTRVPESIDVVATAGATLIRPFYEAALRMRYFGPRVLVEDGSAYSRASLLFNARLAAKLGGRNRLALDVFNLLNASADDIRYSYGSWLPSDAARASLARDADVNPALGGGGVNDDHLHPTQRRELRLTLSRTF